jgi:hypothetical protein
MIRDNEFRKWASLFSGRLFVSIVVYADDSGTHDRTGKQPGSRVAIAAGFAAPIDEWVKFRKDWQAVLTKYDAPYFHFKEWAVASAIVRKKRPTFREFLKTNPYAGWKLKKLDDFLYALAAIAGDGNKIPIVGNFHVARHHRIMSELKLKVGPIPYDNNPYNYCLNDFYRSFIQEVEIQWPGVNDPVTFIFDQTNKREWLNAIHDGFAFYQAKDARFKDLAFGARKDARHLPLQAADMVAYLVRQVTEKHVLGTLAQEKEIPPLERLVFKNLEASIKKLHPYLKDV